MLSSSPKSIDRQIRVFISSTFRDMQAERDYLVKYTFPQLRRFCESRGIIWGEVDLRWGVTDEEAAEGKVLPICLEEIRRCRPYFIGLLGERYGFVPQHIPDNIIAAQPWLEQHRHCSVTELEIIHGVLHNTEMHQQACFYFRDPFVATNVPAKRKADFTSQSFDLQKKLLRLKNDIRHARDKQICQLRESFKTPEELGVWVLEDFTKIIDNLWPEGSPLDPLDREAADHEAFALSRTQIYIERQVYYDRLDVHVAANSTTPIAVLGEPGSGKSALLANWVLRYRQAHPDVFVLQHYVGATPNSADLTAMLHRFIGEFRRRFSIQQDLPDRPDAVRNSFSNWLCMAASKGHVVLVLDALNKLEDRDGALDLLWLPQILSENVRIIVSTLPGRSLEEIQKSNWSTLKVELLTERERTKLLWRFLRQSGKQLSKERRRRIVTSPHTANPLYLNVLLNELRLFGEHERLEQRIGYYLQATLPHELYIKVIDRWEKDYGRDLVRNALSLLWTARQGLSESELLDALGSEDKPMPHARWSPIYLAAVHALLNRSGLIGLAHDHLRRAIEARWLNSGKARRATYTTLASYFTSKQNETMRALDEVPWLLMHAEEWEKLRDFLVNPENLRKLWESDMRMVHRYWHEIESNSSFRVADSYSELLAEPPNAFNFHSQYYAAILLRDFGHSDFVLSWCRKVRCSMAFQNHYINQKQLDNLEVTILLNQGDPKTAVPLLSNMISSTTGSKKVDKALLTISLCHRGSALIHLGHSDEGMQDLLHAEKLAQEIGDMQLTGKVAFERGQSAMYLGNIDSAEEHFRLAENASRAGGDNLTLGSALDSIGSIREFRGDLERALLLYEDEAVICRECSDLFGVARALTAKGIAMGKMPVTEPSLVLPLFEEAERLCQKTSNPQGLACAIGGRGRYLRKLGRYNEALACQVEEMAIWQKLNMPFWLAACLLEQCATHHAMQNTEETMRCFNAANALLEHLGKPPLKDVSLVIQAAESLPGESFVIPILQSLPNNYASAVEAEVTERRILHAIAKDSQLDGESSASVWLHRIELGNLLLVTGRMGDVVPELEKALSVAHEVFRNHPNTSASLNLLAGAHIQQGRYDQAKLLLDEALEVDRETGTKWNQERAQTLSQLALLMMRQERLAEAEDYYRQAIKVLEWIFPTDHEALSITLSGLGCVLDDLGKKEESERLHRWALANDLKAFGPDHPRLATRNHNLGCLLKSVSRLAEARNCFIDVLRIDTKTRGIRSREVATDLVTIAELSTAMGDYQDAAKRFTEATQALQGTESSEKDLCLKLFMLSGKILKNLLPTEARALVRSTFGCTQTAFTDDSSETGQMLRRMVLASEPSADTKAHTRKSIQQPVANDNEITAMLAELNQYQVEYTSVEEGEKLLGRSLHLRKRSQGRQRQTLTELMNRLAIRLQRFRQGDDEQRETIYAFMSDDRELQSAAWSAWFEIAERAVTHGNWELATGAAECSVELLRVLCDAEDAKPFWLANFASALTLKGELELERDQKVSAKLAFEQAKTTYEKLVLLEPGEALYLRGIGVSWDKLGDMARAANDLSSTQHAYEQALTAFRQAARVNSVFLRDLSLCLAKIGELALARQDVIASKRTLNEHFALAASIAKTDANNMEHQRDLAGAHGRMAQLAMTTGDVQKALKHNEAAYLIVELVAGADRSNIRWQQDLAGSLFNFGLLIGQTGNPARGAKMVNQSYEMLRQMDDADQLNAKGKGLLGHLRSLIKHN